ncbi:hypothetical protein [Pseudothauera rhizosphaerae]|uniref:Uncharacterized protein n=1 Tax=Pseudothauera rhizosphaerae TaxID=2565932 RepID=A0A4S4ABC4_9RHOO|nr:hypothetical protein [Pseudothauera rhizosphaerae]THF55933.1 hypothetical protein E6O51_20315 [Pseudothauera rhizosphaerae]
MTATTEAAIFRSGHEALRFAYAYNAQQYPMTIMGRMMRGRPVGSGRGLHGLDGAAEAGNVKRVVQSLPHDYRHALICRYTLSDREFAESANALLKPVIASFGTGTHYTRMALKLICRYFGRADYNLATLCDEFRMDAATMTRRWQRCRDRLKAVESAAENAADDALVEAGLVTSNCV